MKILLSLIFIVGNLFFTPALYADTKSNYPNRPIRIITTDPGGAADIAIRLIAPYLSASLNQPVYVDNRSGGGAITAIETVINSQADGYTLLLWGSPVWLMPQMKPNLPWDPIRDLAPVSLIATQPNVLVVNPSMPVNNIQELINLAKSKPGILNYSSGSTGASNHLAAELFNSMAKVQIERIPYKGGGAALLGLLSNQTQLMFGTAASVKPQIETGKLRALAVTSAQPSPLFPGLPTVASTGLKGYEALTLYALFAPAKTPPATIQIINKQIVAALSNKDVIEKLLKSGSEATPSSPSELAKIIDNDISHWSKLIRESKIQID
jgi:tripartite-type tricarboxylate transporter receptor subunit TctC